MNWNQSKDDVPEIRDDDTKSKLPLTGNKLSLADGLSRQLGLVQRLEADNEEHIAGGRVVQQDLIELEQDFEHFWVEIRHHARQYNGRGDAYFLEPYRDFDENDDDVVAVNNHQAAADGGPNSPQEQASEQNSSLGSSSSDDTVSDIQVDEPRPAQERPRIDAPNRLPPAAIRQRELEQASNALLAVKGMQTLPPLNNSDTLIKTIKEFDLEAMVAANEDLIVENPTMAKKVGSYRNAVADFRRVKRVFEELTEDGFRRKFANDDGQRLLPYRKIKEMIGKRNLDIGDSLYQLERAKDTYITDGLFDEAKWNRKWKTKRGLQMSDKGIKEALRQKYLETNTVYDD
ncbi:hypothetical protein MP228_003797 [Amoeboaphelidium protococcarum]|nr:hypothetical protein MP228_004032 [Amoeboaphelidium protococcarum]KAI3651041.1 hypothetical protein MP228_004522 [Amoeboaphelidium protococcarum]KAI3651351.1 hypothetical protein MP228_003797 [Amoeboaphelidium protococcarum]